MIAMDELDLAFLTPAEAPAWQPFPADDAVLSDGWPATKDEEWTEIALQFELDRVWAEVTELFD
jgi:hypothetical protein